MGPELAVFRAIIELFWPTLCLAKMAILNTVQTAFLHNFSARKYFHQSCQAKVFIATSWGMTLQM